MRHFGITILITFLTVTAFAQQYTREQQDQINEFNAILEDDNSHDTSKAAAYIGLTEIMGYMDWGVVEPFALKTLAITNARLIEEEDPAIIKSLMRSKAYATNNIGVIKLYEGDYVNGIELAEEALYIRRQIDDKEGIRESLSNIAGLHSILGNHKKSLELYHQSVEIGESAGDPAGLSQSYVNLGALYAQREDYDQAIEYGVKGLESAREANVPAFILNALSALAGNYEMLENHDEALNYLDQSWPLARDLEHEQILSGLFHIEGRIHMKEGRLDSALSSFKRSMDIRSEMKDRKGVSQSMKHIGDVYLQKLKKEKMSPTERTKMLSEAKSFLEESLEIAEELGDVYRLMHGADILGQIYEFEGDNAGALEMHRLYTTMKDSTGKKEQEEVFMQEKLRIEYENKKALDDAERDKQIAVERAETEKQQIMTYSAVGGIGLTGALLFVVFNRLRVTRKQKQIIESQKALVEESHKEITDSIHYAKRIQAAVLPPDSIVKQHLPGSFILYKPKDIVAGDFYWLEEKAGTIFFAAADCTGHGVPGAMVSVVCVSGLNRSLREMNILEPGKILDKTRELVVKEFEKSDENVQDGMDIALCSLKGKTLQYAGAHNPLWIVRNGELLETKADKQPIGKYDNPQPYTTHTIELQEGDSLYIFSDGYPDQFGGEQGKKYKSGKFKQFLTSIADEPIRDQKKLLDREFEGWRGNHEQIDDVCVIGLKV